VLGSDGKPLGQIIEVDQNRLHATGERIVRGLYFLEAKRPVASGAKIRVASIPGLTASSEPEEMVRQIARVYKAFTDQRAKALGNIFNYAAAFHGDFSVWLLILYHDFAWAASITPSETVASRDIYSRKPK
jgi:hypothetical protein